MKSKAAASTIDSPRHPASFAGDPGWRHLFEDSEDAQLICAFAGEIVAANRKAIQLLRFNPATATAPSLVFEFLNPDASAQVADWLRSELKQPQPAHAVTFVSGGEARHLVDLRLAPLDEGFSLITLRDASRRWRMESHVQRLLTAVDATPDVVFLADREFRLTFVNAAFQAVTGVAPMQSAVSGETSSTSKGNITQDSVSIDRKSVV